MAAVYLIELSTLGLSQLSYSTVYLVASIICITNNVIIIIVTILVLLDLIILHKIDVSAPNCA